MRGLKMDLVQAHQLSYSLAETKVPGCRDGTVGFQRYSMLAPAVLCWMLVKHQRVRWQEQHQVPVANWFVAPRQNPYYRLYSCYTKSLTKVDHGVATTAVQRSVKTAMQAEAVQH